MYKILGIYNDHTDTKRWHSDGLWEAVACPTSRTAEEHDLSYFSAAETKHPTEVTHKLLWLTV